MAKPRLTREEHDDMGRTLAGIQDELARRVGQLANAYPRTGTGSEPHRKLKAALAALNAARSALDSALFAEHPDTAESTVYYPHPEDRSVIVPPDGGEAP